MREPVTTGVSSSFARLLTRLFAIRRPTELEIDFNGVFMSWLTEAQTAYSISTFWFCFRAEPLWQEGFPAWEIEVLTTHAQQWTNMTYQKMDAMRLPLICLAFENNTIGKWCLDALKHIYRGTDHKIFDGGHKPSNAKLLDLCFPDL